MAPTVFALSAFSASFRVIRGEREVRASSQLSLREQLPALARREPHACG
jgi:hypothetical protein